MTDEPEDPLIAVETEAALLGALLQNNELIKRFAGALKVTDFAEPLHGRIFSAMMRFAGVGKATSAVTLRPIFVNDPAGMGGDYLDRLAETPAVMIGTEQFVEHIKMLAQRRRVRETSRKAIERLETDFDTSVPEIAAPVQEASFDAEDDDQPVSIAADIGIVSQHHARIAEGEALGAANAYVNDIDKSFGPLEDGTYMIVAGRPGMGKSMCASSMALGYAANGNPGLYLHAEMTPLQVAQRRLSDFSLAMGRPVEHKRIRRGDLTQQERAWLNFAGERLALLPLKSKAIAGWSIRRVVALIEREKAILAANGQKLTFAVVDYLQLLKADIDGREITDERALANAVSRGFRAVSSQTGVSIIALSQLNRGVEQRPDKRPMMSDLKESGKLEEDADQIALLFREEYYLSKERPKDGEKDPKTGRSLLELWNEEMDIARGKIDIIAGKNRHDEPQTRTARFIGKQTAIRSGDSYENEIPSTTLFGEDL